MSGLEVAGLVLGLWPVVLTLVKGYKASRSGDSAAFLRDFSVQQTIYKRCIEKLLQENRDFSDDDRVELEEDRLDMMLWRSALFEQQLRERVGAEDFDTIVYVLGDIQTTMNELQAYLESGEVDLTSDRSRGIRMRSTLRQMRMNLPQSNFQKAFGKLKDKNNLLHQLVQLFDEPRGPPIRKTATSRPRRGSKPKRQRRAGLKHINDLSQAIESSYDCDCAQGHEAGFWVSGDDPFQILFMIDEPERSFSDFSLQSRPTMETDISTIEVEGSSVQNSPADDSGISLMESLQRASLSRRTSQDDDRTCWSCSSPSSPGGRSRERRSLPLLFSPMFSGSGDSLAQIRDMCNLVKRLAQANSDSPSPRASLGKLGRGQSLFTARPTEESVTGISTSIACLEDVLPPSDEWSLSRQKRIDIAQKLALAIVQFWSTAWIGKWWTWRDFSLKNDNQREMQIFVTRTIFPGAFGMRQTQNPAKIWKYLREPLLIRLGFALIELALGKRLSRLREEGKFSDMDSGGFFGSCQDAIDYDTAMTILDRNVLQEEVGVTYQGVVAACLKCEIIQDTGAISLTTAANSFQNDVENFVVQPLHEYFENTWGAII